MQEKDQLTKAAGVVGTSTLISRIFGYIRDMIFAAFFGAGIYSDAFIAAFRIPNMLRRLFGEGSLSIAFVPVFTEYLTKRGRRETIELAGSAFKLISAILAVVVICGIILAPVIIKIIAPGFTDSPEKFSMAVILTRIMFPYIFFIGLVALSMGILNVLGHFAAPALAPVLLNLAMIAAVSATAFLFEDARVRVYGLAAGVVAGGFLQLGLQVPFLMKQGIFLRQKATLLHSGLKKIGHLMIPAVFGSAVYQINTLIGTLLASTLSEGSVTYLYLADRLVQFPLGLFGISAATAALPSFSRQVVARDIPTLKETLAQTMKLVGFIILPAMIGLIVLRDPIIRLLFMRGAFGTAAADLTAYALLYYSIGLWAFSAVRIVVSVFYAFQDTRTPFYSGLVSVIANALLGLVLMKSMGHGGLALALSLASMLNLGILSVALRFKVGALRAKPICIAIGKTLLCAGIMGAVVWQVAALIIPAETTGFCELFWTTVGSIAIGVVVYLICSYGIQGSQLKLLLEAYKRKSR